MKVVIATPTITRPHDAYLKALEDSIPAMDAAGFDHYTVFEVGCTYISHARSKMLRKALDHNADVIVFIDHDMSWRPQDLVTIIRQSDPVVAGTYRFKEETESYMGTLKTDAELRPLRRADGCVLAEWVPAGFLKMTKEAVDQFMRWYPELKYGPHYAPYIDIFNHGAWDNIWYGEDYAFSRRWNAKGGEIWLQPNLHLDHHSADKCYPGNFHEFMLKQPGGSNASNIHQLSAA